MEEVFDVTRANSPPNIARWAKEK